MKKYYNRNLKFVLCFFSLLILTGVKAVNVNYYPKAGNTDLSQVSQWTTSVNGIGGTSPVNFSTANHTFNITGVTNSSPTIAASWTVSGTGSILIIGDGITAVNFIIPSAYKVTGKLSNITANATLTISNSNSLTGITWPSNLDPTSTVDFLNLNSFTLPILTATTTGYGNIIFDKSSVNNVIIANVAFAGNLTLQNTGSFNSTFLSPDLRGNADQTITGNNLTLTVNNFIDTLKTGGNIILAPNTPINFDKDMWLKQSGPANQFMDGGNTLSCLGNLNMNGLASGYNFTGTMIIAGSQGTTPQKLDDDNQYSSPGAIVAAFNNLVINCSNPVQFITNAANETITINGNFIVASSGNHTVTLCTTSAATGNHTFNFLGDFMNNQNMPLNFNAATVYSFNGNNGQTISTVATYETFTNLTINDPSGITLSSPINVSGILNLSNGIINANDTTDVLLLKSTASCPVGGSVNSYVNGPVAKIGNSPFEFPVGASGRFMPLAISAPATNTDTITVDYIFDVPVNSMSVAAPLTNVSSLEYWYITQSVATDTVSLTLYWQTGNLSGIYYYDSTLRVANYNGGLWHNLGNTAVSGIFPGAGSVTSATEVTGMNGQFTFGNSNNNTNPLPISLSSFTANYMTENNSVLTEWTVESQLNNKEFVIEKTQDGTNYTEVARTPGAGTTAMPQSYSAYDYSPSEGISYYRLKQIDVDGNSSEFTPVPVYINTKQYSTITLYPNPVNDLANLNYISEDGEPITICITDMTGRTLCCKTYSDVKKGENNFLINTSGLISGVYFMKINSPQKNNCLKFIK